MPGFRSDVAGHDAGWLLPDIADHLKLGRAGLELVVPDACVFSPQPDGRSLTLWSDPARTAEEIGRFSPDGRPPWPAFTAQLARFARVLEAPYAVTPPRIPDARGRDFAHAARPGPPAARARAARDGGVPARGAHVGGGLARRLVRHRRPQGRASGRGGVTRILQGPRSAGTAFVLLHHQVGRPAGSGARRAPRERRARDAGARPSRTWRRAYGAEIRTAAPVREIVVRDGRAIGVALETGEHIAARARGVERRPPRARSCGLVARPRTWTPNSCARSTTSSSAAPWRKVHLALGELPQFSARAAEGRCAARSRSRPASTTWSARTTTRSTAACRASRISRRASRRCSTRGSPRRAARDDASRCSTRPTICEPASWDAARPRARWPTRSSPRSRAYAPNLRGQRAGAPRRDAEGPGRALRAHRGAPLPWGTDARPDSLHAAGGRMGPLPDADRGLFLCGAGTHPGGGLAGAPGRNAARELLQKEGRR